MSHREKQPETRLRFAVYNTDELQVSNLSVLVWLDTQTLEQGRCAEPVVLRSVICVYQRRRLWWEENKSAKRQQIQKIPQVSQFIYLHFPGLPAAKKQVAHFGSEIDCKMCSTLNGWQSRRGRLEGGWKGGSRMQVMGSQGAAHRQCVCECVCVSGGSGGYRYL